MVYPLSLIATSIDSLLGSDCDLALLRPEPDAFRFRWEELLKEPAAQCSFRRCMRARGYCLVTMPAEKLAPTAGVFAQGQEFFQQSRAAKALHRNGGTAVPPPIPHHAHATAAATVVQRLTAA